MDRLLIIGDCFNMYNPYAGFEIIGFILVILMVVLIIRQKRKAPKEIIPEEVAEPVESFHTEKDVFGLDKVSVNHNEPNYKPANKAKLKYVVYIILILVGLMMIVLSTNKKYGPANNPYPTVEDTFEQSNGNN